MKKIDHQAIRIGIVGLGYVGLPLAVAFGELYEVVGWDVDGDRIAELQRGFDRTREMDQAEIEQAKGLKFTADAALLRDCTIYIVTVPTPLHADHSPDLSYLIQASETIGNMLKVNDIVIYESTVYPGCTEEVCVPVLEKTSGLVFNHDFFVGYSPERINPGDRSRKLKDIKKLVAGSTDIIAGMVQYLYDSIIKAGTHLTPSIKVAEAAKAIENAQRDVNISFMNELALMFDKMGIDTGDVLEAAGTKWNFLPFRPGLVGGHCIGVDPHYLVHKARAVGYEPKLIAAGREINDHMGIFVADKIIAALAIKHKGQIQGLKVLVLGFAFKENCPDTRNTKVADVVKRLAEAGIQVMVYDPLVDDGCHKAYPSIEFVNSAAQEIDALVLAVAHSIFESINYTAYKNEGALIVDVKGVVSREDCDLRI